MRNMGRLGTGEGAVVKSIKTSYREIFAKVNKADRQAIRLAMREQHERILDRLVSGHLDPTSVE